MMKRFRLPVLVFLLVFFFGTGSLMLKEIKRNPLPPQPQPRQTEPVKGILPPLNLSNEQEPSDASNTWEYEGETKANFISAKAKFSSALLHEGWKPDRQITIDDKLDPRVLLTFRKDTLELVLMLWRIDAGTTGFAYKREKIVNPGVMLE